MIAAETRLWAKVSKTQSCWLWTAYVNQGGYGQLRVGRSFVKVHRLAYELLIGPIPEGHDIDHLCRVRNCVNPAHLEAVTERENVHRSECPAAVNRRKTHCIHGHEFSPSNTALRNGRRNCLACRRRRNAGRG